MSTNLVTLNGKELPDEAPGKQVININITQESSLTYLFKAMGQCFAKQQEATQKTATMSGPSSNRWCYKGEQKVLGSIQILLGLLCVTLGVLDSVQQPIFYCYIEAGAPFWMGGLFVLSGALSIVAERHGGRWVHLATFLHLGSIVAGIVALTFGIAGCATYYGYVNVCERQQYRPWYVTDVPDDNWAEQRCLEYVWKLVSAVIGVRILLLIFSIAAILISLVSFGYGLWVFCRSLQANNTAYATLGDLEVPPPYEDQARMEQGAACPIV